MLVRAEQPNFHQLVDAGQESQVIGIMAPHPPDPTRRGPCTLFHESSLTGIDSYCGYQWEAYNGTGQTPYRPGQPGPGRDSDRMPDGWT